MRGPCGEPMQAVGFEDRVGVKEDQQLSGARPGASSTGDAGRSILRVVVNHHHLLRGEILFSQRSENPGQGDRPGSGHRGTRHRRRKPRSQRRTKRRTNIADINHIRLGTGDPCPHRLRPLHLRPLHRMMRCAG